MFCEIAHALAGNRRKDHLLSLLQALVCPQHAMSRALGARQHVKVPALARSQATPRGP
jgi:hypothetical protein